MNPKIANIVATFFGSGLSPKASGTAGSLATLPMAFLLCFFSGSLGIVIAAVIWFILGVPATHELIKNQEEKDPKKVVVDEVVGQLLSFTLVADALHQNLDKWYVYFIGFAFFRFFDICKMGPVKWFDSKMKNAYGVMMDDVCAGIFASVCLWMVCTYFHIF